MFLGNAPESRESEVVDIMMTLFDDEQILKAYAKDIEDKTARETAERMIKDGEMPLEKIVHYVPELTMEELKEMKSELMQMV